VSASNYEGFGLSTIEAMSAATVPVVTSVGAHPDVIQNGVSGFLTDAAATELSAYIERVLAMPQEKATAMGEAARAATRRFSWTEIVPQYEQLYHQVIETGHAGARA
jgi:alpha-1,3-mannosyltransferase